MANLLQLTASDVKKWLNPTGKGGNSGVFDYGTGKTLSEASVNEVCDTYAGFVIGRTPEKYRKLIHRIEGETFYIADSVSTIQLGLSPVSNVYIYQGYHSNMASRLGNRMNSNLYSVNPTTGLVTFTAAQSNTILYADYDHTAGDAFLELRKLTLDLIAEHYAKALPWLGENEDYTTNGATARGILRDGTLGIDALDNLNLYKETRSDAHTLRGTATNGW